jgi:hypothetical protein
VYSFCFLLGYLRKIDIVQKSKKILSNFFFCNSEQSLCCTEIVFRAFEAIIKKQTVSLHQFPLPVPLWDPMTVALQIQQGALRQASVLAFVSSHYPSIVAVQGPRSHGPLALQQRLWGFCFLWMKTGWHRAAATLLV